MAKRKHVTFLPQADRGWSLESEPGRLWLAHELRRDVRQEFSITAFSMGLFEAPHESSGKELLVDGATITQLVGLFVRRPWVVGGQAARFRLLYYRALCARAS